jgi:serine/threonine protein kinase
MNQEHDFIKEHAQKIMKDSAAAFAFMNKSGWCHRDIKPDNILVDATGVVKIIDFAISKRVPGALGRWFHKRGKPSGTRSYMSPQQIRDEPPDWRDDIYSYGATLYDLFTGRPPFRGLSEEDLMNKQLFATPDAPSVYNRALTEEFDKFVLWMLAKKRDDRPRNFYEILMKLKTLRVWKVGRK